MGRVCQGSGSTLSGMAEQRHKVAVLLDRGSARSAGVLAGVSRSVVSGQAWAERVEVRVASVSEAAMHGAMAWGADGLLVEVNDVAIARAAERLQDTGTAAVNVNGSVATPTLATVRLDGQAVGARAGAYWLERGYQQLAVVYFKGCIEGHGIAEGLHAAVGASNAVLEVCALEMDEVSDPLGLAPTRVVADFLRPLRWPVAVTAVGLDTGSWTLSACATLTAKGVQAGVPERVAVLSVGGQGGAWGLCDPALSTMGTADEAVGQAAAGVLAEVMRRGLDEPDADRPTEVRVPPGEVVTRASSDTRAVGDAKVARALGVIRRRATQAVTVERVLDEVAVSRRGLEQKFQRMLGRTPLQEIHRVRIEHAKQLLLSTNFSVEEVARSSGFASALRLSDRFKRLTGETPTAWRRRERALSAGLRGVDVT